MKITLTNGVTVEGTLEQINAVAKTFGLTSVYPEDKYYYSRSKGEYLLIKDMNTMHLRNAVLVMFGAWQSTLKTITDPRKLCMALGEGPDPKDYPTFYAMVKELYTRE